MKLNKLTVFSAAFALSVTALVSACGQQASSKSAVEKIVEQAQTMSRDEVYKKAAEELGDNEFHWLGTSSRGGKDKVRQAFVAELKRVSGKEFDFNKIKYDTTVDGKVYTILNGYIESGQAYYSGALLQDGYQLQTKGISKGYVNYVPKEWNEKEGVNKSRDANPFSLQFQYKTWMYNNHNNDYQIDNVWDFAKSGMVIDTMDPTNENVNMDWLIQLTSDENAALLKEAFNDASNSSGIAASELEKYAAYGADRKYSFLFMEKFIKNAVFYADDGKAQNAFISSPGHAAWIVYSKLMNLAETEQTTKRDVVVAALGTQHSDGANPGASKLKGFGGFMYKHYLMVMPNAPLPWTTCAFINFLSTTENGYQGWKSDVGDYPTYGDEINANRTKLGHGTLNGTTWTQDDNGENVFPCLNDPGSNWWIDTAKAPVETPSYIATYYNAVAAFIMQEIAKK